MATTVTSVISTTGNDHGTGLTTYSTLQSWEDDTDNDLVSADEIQRALLYNDGEFVVTSTFLVSGATTDATRYRELTTAAGQSFRDHADKLTNALAYDQSLGVGIRTASAYTSCLENRENHFRASNLQLKETSNATNINRPLGSINAAALFHHILAEHTATTSRVGTFSSAVIKCINCIFIASGSNPGAAVSFSYPSSGAGLFNCTVVKPSDADAGGTGVNQGGGGTSGNCIIKNTAVFGFGTAFNGSFHADSGYNATDAASAPGSNNQTSLTFADQFEDTATATQDWRVKTGNDLEGVGTPDSSNTGDVDIIGQSRSTTAPTIGAWEVITGGGGSFQAAWVRGSNVILGVRVA